MAEKTIGICGGCIFWERFEDIQRRGECHRYPPVRFSLSEPRGSWAETNFSQGCGEWLPRHPEEEEEPSGSEGPE